MLVAPRRHARVSHDASQQPANTFDEPAQQVADAPEEPTDRFCQTTQHLHRSLFTRGLTVTVNYPRRHANQAQGLIVFVCG